MTGLGHAAKGHLFIFLIALLLVGLPIAVWLDLSDLVETNLRRQASDVNSIISSVRLYYANNVVGRILASPGTTKVVHNYKDYPGAIPIPATLSLELGKVVGEQQKNITYRFVSDYPFKNRAPHAFDDFETDALSRLRQNSNQQLIQISSSVFSDGVRLIAPVMMEQPCVNCHNSHPESLKRLEGWRCSRHPGSVDFSANRRQHIRIQIPTSLFWAHCRGWHCFHFDATAAGSDNQCDE